MHVHTRYSNDAFITSRELVIYSRKRGLDGVAITDHDTVGGLREFSRIKGLLVIPGVEITTSQGHVLAINVSTVVEGGLSFAETVERIHDAGGLAIVAHPTAFFKGIAEDQLGHGFDGLEVINSCAVPFRFSVRRNRKIAAKLNVAQTGGSDAHYAPEIGMAYTLIEAETGVDDVVETIRRGATTPFGRSTPWSIRLKRVALNMKKRWRRA